MALLFLTVLAVFALLVASEIWWRVRRPHDELSRKFVHITVGSFAAFWPWYLTDGQILFIALAFIAGVLVSKYAGVFTAIHAVQRPTWGELAFAAAIGLLALAEVSDTVFAAALLHMGLADGLAAIIGTRYGRDNRYQVFGHTKSVTGSGAFFMVSLFILTGYAALSGHAVAVPLIVLIAGVSALMENVAIRGLDNLTVPLFVAAVLTVLS